MIRKFSNAVLKASPEDLAYVNAYLAKRNGGGKAEEDLFSDYCFLGEIKPLPSSDSVKEKWPGWKNTPESIINFLNRNYSNFLGYGMTRAHLEKIDHGALVALRVWEKKEGRRWHAMPTTKEHNDAVLRWRAQVSDAEFERVFVRYAAVAACLRSETFATLVGPA